MFGTVCVRHCVALGSALCLGNYALFGTVECVCSAYTQFSSGTGPVCLRASEVEKSDIDFQVQRLADNIIIVCTLTLDFSARTSAPLLLAPPSSFKGLILI